MCMTLFSSAIPLLLLANCNCTAGTTAGQASGCAITIVHKEPHCAHHCAVIVRHGAWCCSYTSGVSSHLGRCLTGRRLFSSGSPVSERHPNGRPLIVKIEPRRRKRDRRAQDNTIAHGGL